MALGDSLLLLFLEEGGEEEAMIAEKDSQEVGPG